jgi:tRNA pseudouridine38-40 synthase
MVRRLVGTQVAVGRGYITPDEFQAIFRSRDLSRARWIAPPQGLVLHQVAYPPPGIRRDDYLQAMTT